MNLKEDFISRHIALKPDYEGCVKAVLVSSKYNKGGRNSVLYIHGYIDYFFHPHVAEKFHENNFDFYALDLRKYGRALLEHQRPNYCKRIDEYFEEISIAIREIKIKSKSVFLLGHSTGGLITSSYMNDGAERMSVNGLILNSPFLDFNQSKIEKVISKFLAKTISHFFEYANLEGVLTPIYAESIHKDYRGEWDFNLKWKPTKGFLTYFKWVSAIGEAQNRLNRSNIKVPVLVMHSSGSFKPKEHSADVMTNDVVLNIDDIKRVGVQLGKYVTLCEIENAQHDIFLSSKSVREEGFREMFSWLDNI